MLDLTLEPNFPVRFIVRDEMLILHVEGVMPCWGGVWLEPRHFIAEESPMPDRRPFPPPPSDLADPLTNEEMIDLGLRLGKKRPSWVPAILVMGAVFALGVAFGALLVLALT